MGDQSEQQAVPVAQEARRVALIERIGTIADLACTTPLTGELGDVAYDLLRQAAAQISSDRLYINRLASLPCKSGEGADHGLGPHATVVDDCEDGFMSVAIVVGENVYLAQGGEQITMSREQFAEIAKSAIDATQTREAEGLQEISEDDLREAIQQSIDHPGMTQNLFARQTGISKGHLSEFLSGKRRAEPAIAGPCGYRWALVHDTRATDDLTDAALNARGGA